MKKLFPIFVFALLSFMVVSCDSSDDVIIQESNAVDARMKDVTVNLNASNGYSYVEPINILASDVVLVYRRDASGSSPAWQLIPKTYYLSGGRELDYNFLFDQKNIEIYTDWSFDPATMSSAEVLQYHTAQTFRMVIIPADPAKNSNKPDYNDYNAVVKYYNLKEPK